MATQPGSGFLYPAQPFHPFNSSSFVPVSEIPWKVFSCRDPGGDQCI